MSYLRLSDLSQGDNFMSLPVTNYELGRIKALEAAGVAHEAAKAQIYAERGPGGEPKSVASPGDPLVPSPRQAVVTPPVAPAVVEVVKDTPWETIAKVGLAGLAISGLAFVASRIFKAESKPLDDAGDQPTGVFARNAGRAKMHGGVVYEDGETGWVEDLGDGTFRIANVPMSDRVNMNDVVTIKEKHGRPTVDKVVRRAFTKKSGIEYPKPFAKNYKKLCRALEGEGWALEGQIEGMALLAHDGRKSPEVVASEVGVEITAEAMPLGRV